LRKFTVIWIFTILFMGIFINVDWSDSVKVEGKDVCGNVGAYATHAPIRINSNSDFTMANGVSSGDGSPNHPWIIENYTINGAGYGCCLYIGNTTNHFVIQNCILFNASGIPFVYYRNSGVALYNVQNGSLIDNVILNNQDFGTGIWLQQSSHNVISNCSVSNSIVHNIRLWESSENTIEKCKINGTGWGYGIGLNQYSYSNSIKRNIITNTSYGVSLTDARYNNIEANNFSWNRYANMEFDHLGVYNWIYHNNFYNSLTGSQVNDGGVFGNMWDDGYPSGGNYWSDYLGTDFNSGTYQNIPGCDGVGDSPYICGAATDQYPLTNPWGMVSPTPPNSTVINVYGLYWWTTSSLALEAYVTDNYTNVKNVTLVYRFSWNNITWDVWSVYSTDTFSPWSWNFNFPKGNGYYEFYCISVDTTGNIESAPISSDASCALDSANPIANSGGGRFAMQYALFIFNGSNSSDNFGIVNYTWTFTNNGTSKILYGSSPKFQFWSIGIYFVTLNVTDAAGNWDLDIGTVTVIDGTMPIANAGNDLTVEQGTIVIFNGSTSYDNIGIVNYTWIFTFAGAAIIRYGIIAFFNFTIPGNYTIILTVMDATGNTANDTKMILVYISPPLDTDRDGVIDEIDRFPYDPTEWNDTDEDGVGDNSDVFPEDPNEWQDTDKDGVGDNSDRFPEDPTEWIDSDGDGIGDNSDKFPNDRTEWYDTDGDGVGDNSDVFPHDPSEWIDTDGDGVGDNSDLFPMDPERWDEELTADNNIYIIIGLMLSIITFTEILLIGRDDKP
jgi:parallel beta-helix repeat protein